jgi:hypothetical protein
MRPLLSGSKAVRAAVVRRTANAVALQGGSVYVSEGLGDFKRWGPR